MKNIFIQNIDKKRYAEITKPAYNEIPNLPLGVINCGFAKIFETYTAPLWKHRGFVLMYVCEGKGSVRIEGQRYSLEKGNVLCYRTLHSNLVLSPASQDWNYKWIEIYGSATSFYYNLINQKTFPMPAIYNFPLDVLQYHYDRIVQNLMSDGRSACYKNISVLTELLTALLLEKETTPAYTEEKYAKCFANLFSYVEKNYFNPITVDEMARVFGISKYYFIRVFKQFVNTSPMKYVRNFRIAKATELLLLTERSVEEIAEIIGYKTSTQLISNFRDVTGTTPFQYRKTHKNGGSYEKNNL